MFNKKIYLIIFFVFFFINSSVYARNYTDVAIIGAMDCEVSNIKKNIEKPKIKKYNNLEIITGKIAKNKVVVVKCGVGKVNAGIITQYLIDNYKPKYIINTGIAGGLDKNVKIFDIVIGNTLVQYDFNLSAFGYSKGYMSTGIQPDKPTVYYCDDKLIKILYENIKTKYPSIDVHIGSIATGDSFVSNKVQKKEIHDYFKSIANDMESAAIAQSANINNVPCVIIRAISDLSDGSAVKNYNEFEIKTADFSAKLLRDILQTVDFRKLKNE